MKLSRFLNENNIMVSAYIIVDREDIALSERKGENALSDTFLRNGASASAGLRLPENLPRTGIYYISSDADLKEAL